MYGKKVVVKKRKPKRGRGRRRGRRKKKIIKNPFFFNKCNADGFLVKSIHGSFYFSKNVVFFGTKKINLFFNSFFFDLDPLYDYLSKSLPNQYCGPAEKITNHNLCRGQFDDKV